MKILQLAPRLPYPLSDGGAVNIFKPTEAIAALGADITFVTFPEEDDGITARGAAKLSKFTNLRLCSRKLPSRRSTLIRTAFKGAYPVERRMMPEMFELLRSIVERERFDLVHVDHAHMGKYALWLKQEYGYDYVLREHNFEALIYERFARTQSNPVKRFLASLHGRRLKIEEAGFVLNAAHVIPITEEDRRIMRTVAPKQQHYTVIPAGVEIEYFKPSNPSDVIPYRVMWIGGIDWDPNRDSIEYFLREIWPLVIAKQPNARLDVVGSQTENLRIPDELVGSVSTHGRVPDARPYMAQAAVVVVPLRAGGGMRLKILDFLAAGKAVVSTSIGAEGNQARHGEQLLLADQPADFANSIIRLFEDHELRYQLGVAGRELVENVYAWPKIGQAIMTVYESVLARKDAPISVAGQL